MDKSMKKNVLIIAILVSLAIVFVPIYFFVLADANDNNKFKVINTKIIAMQDGTLGFDADDTDGNDSSDHNNRVRTFDRIRYTVEYTLTEKTQGSTSQNTEGRNVLVEVLIPTTYNAVLKYGEEITADMNDSREAKNIGGTNYYYASFEVPAATLNNSESSRFDFILDRINSTDIANNNSIKPKVYIKETTDTEAASISSLGENDTLPGDIGCALETTITDPDTGTTSTTTSNVCDVTITGKSAADNYFVNLYAGSKKTDERIVPVGIILGLRSQEGKGIKGLIIPDTIEFTVTSSDASKLTFNENSFMPYTTYQSNTDYRIDITENNDEMPEIRVGNGGNGSIEGTINNNVATITVSGIKPYIIRQFSDQFYYFSTDYFLTTLAERTDYNDINVNLVTNKNNSSNQPSSVQINDSFHHVLGNYSSTVDIYESSLSSEDTSEALEYGKANLNYGSDFALKVSFDYAGGDGLTSLTNYVKIDNDVFKLINDKTSNKGYNFVAGEVTSVPTIKIDTDETGSNPHEKVLFGFGEWTSAYFEIATGNDVPANCPNSIDSLTKEQLMNLYGGPCINAKETVKWAYSPTAENDINGDPIEIEKGPLIVKSTYVSYNAQYIEPGSSGTLELYGTVKDDYSIVNSAHQIVTNGTAYAKNNQDFRYLGNASNDGTTLLSNKDNFIKTGYDFNNRNVITINSNVCSDSTTINNKCPVSGNTILISAIKVTKPVIKSYKATDLNTPESRFYYYPLALKINANASKSDADLRIDTIYVDVYLPDYMIVDDNFGVTNEKVPTSVENTTLANVRSKFGKEAPETNANYKVYHYVLTAESTGLNEDEITNLQKGILSDFTIYSDIDLITTPNASTPEIYTEVDFAATKYITTDNTATPIVFNSITPTTDRFNSLENVILYNLSAVTTKGSITPNNIEKNGTYEYTMIAYNHSNSIVSGGYNYPTADLYYILPYDGDLASTEISSKIGTTKFKVSVDEASFNSISNPSDYKFYYATTGVPSSILASEIKTTSDVNAIWKEWENPVTKPVSNAVAIKIVKQTPFAPDTYFGSSEGIKLKIKAVGSSEGNVYYNSFHILASKPDNYTCDDTIDDPDYCSEARQTKANYASSSSKASVYERVISGFVFEDFDYNGIYTEEESKLKDIPVSLYKIDTIPENYDPIDPSTFVKDTDTLIGATVTGENGNYYFGGLSSGNYYVSFTIDNEKYIVTDLKKVNDSIANSSNNNSSGSLLPGTNKAITDIITFEENDKNSKLIVNNINFGLAVKKEMAISLNKYITEVTVTKDGKEDVYDYSNQNMTQVSITVLNPKNTKVRVKYSFSVENTKYFPGYIGLIVDNMPEGMTFNPNLKENQYWVMYDNLLYYNGLSGRLLLPNEKQYFTLVLDLDLKEAGTYRNVVSARDITLMGEDLPVYDFSGLNNTNTQNTEGGE